MDTTQDSAIAARFWAAVDRSAGPRACWIWMGGQQFGGYGVFHPEHGLTARAHRWSLEHHLGRKLRPTEFACHRCDNPTCVNPAHLFVGTHRQNMADMRAKGRSSRGGQRPNAKLQDWQVVAIRVAASEGTPSRALADEYEISEAAVCMIIRGQRWAHLGGPITEHYQTKKKAA